MEYFFCSYNKVRHEDLTFHQLVNGTLSKILSEIPPERLDPELANMLSFLQFLVEMSFRYDHKDVLETCREMLMAWQNKQFEWTHDWSTLDDRLKGYRQRFVQTPQPHTYTKGLAGQSKDRSHGAGAGAGGGNPNRQPKPKSGAQINGVPKSFIKANDICIKFNESENPCTEKGSHQNRYSEKKSILRHICAGCFAKDKSEEHHPVHSCKKDFGSLFQRW